MKSSRRSFIKIIGLSLCSNFIYSWLKSLLATKKFGKAKCSDNVYASVKKSINIGVEKNGLSYVYMVKDENNKNRNFLKDITSSERNMKKVIDMMGGIEKFIQKNDIVIIKPNAQRYNQGMTNTDAIKGFIDLVLDINDFNGEIIIAENHQFQKDNDRGWTTEQRNGKFNLNELVNFYQEKGYKNVTKYHWHNAGPCKFPLEGNSTGNNVVHGPEDGDGYVWMDNNYYKAPTGRKCILSYPVFTSKYSGIRIDLKNGAWKNGEFVKRDLKFINFSALNHHGSYAGVTASVKNLMGVVDMTCGFPGDKPKGTYNVHHIGVSKIKHLVYHSLKLRKFKGKTLYKIMDYCYRNFHHTGGALGKFITSVRAPDLNIISADLVGWGDRKKLDKAFRPMALLASKDPVALDYVAAKKVLLPGTPTNKTERSGKKYHDLNNPDSKNSKFKKFLIETNKQGVGNIDKEKIKVIKHIFKENT